jgi:hypothetical protein
VRSGRRLARSRLPASGARRSSCRRVRREPNSGANAHTVERDQSALHQIVQGTRTKAVREPFALYNPLPVRRYSPRPSPPAPATQGALRVFLPLALPFAILAGVAVFAVLTPQHQVSASGPGHPGALVWGDGIFANRVELKAWLAQHGGSYQVWLRDHPSAKVLLARHATVRKAESRPAIAARSATAKPKGVMRPPTGAANTAPPSGGGASGTSRSVSMSIIFAIFAALGLLGAALPRSFIQRIGLSDQIVEVRLGMAMVGLAILCGMALALA